MNGSTLMPVMDGESPGSRFLCYSRHLVPTIRRKKGILAKTVRLAVAYISGENVTKEPSLCYNRLIFRLRVQMHPFLAYCKVEIIQSIALTAFNHLWRLLAGK